MKLYCPKGDLHGQKVLLTAAFSDTQLDLPPFAVGKDDKQEPFIKACPLARVPALQTDMGEWLVGSNAVCRFLARMRNDKRLYGETLQQSGEVDMWLDFCANDLEVPLFSCASQSSLANKAKADVSNALKIIDNHLKLRTYIVGERITIADICLCVVICHAAKQFGSSLIAPHAELLRWKDTICNQKSFKKVLTDCCSKAASAGDSAAATASKPKATAKPEADDEEAAPQPKVKCELDLLPPSPLDLNEWKRVYSNTKNFRGEAIPWLWKNFDASGYCFYYMKYEKLEGECTVPFLTSNQLGGFMQRIDNNLRKYSFAVLDVVGKDSCYDIQGVWMFRGLGIPQMMKDHPSFEYNLWKRLDHTKAADRVLIEDYFCNDDEVENTPIADSKVWK